MGNDHSMQFLYTSARVSIHQLMSLGSFSVPENVFPAWKGFLSVAWFLQCFSFPGSLSLFAYSSCFHHPERECSHQRTLNVLGVGSCSCFVLLFFFLVLILCLLVLLLLLLLVVVVVAVAVAVAVAAAAAALAPRGCITYSNTYLSKYNFASTTRS